MPLKEILLIISGVFKFWDQVTWLIRKLQDSPEEARQKIIVKIGEESHDFAQTGRPKWE